MTIAAAFRFEHGVILCCDNEYTHPTMKLPGKKILFLNVPNLDMDIAVAFAGTVPVAKMAIQQFESHLKRMPSGTMTEENLVSELNEFLLKFHEKNIFQHPRYQYQDGPSIYMVVVPWFKKSNEVSVFTTDETNVVVEHGEFAAVGIGREFAEQVVAPLGFPRYCTKSRKEILLLATHMLYQVKKYVSYCGNASSFMHIGNGNFSPVYDTRLVLPEAYSETFELILAELFYAAADLNLDDEMVAFMCKLTDTRIKEIRKEQRLEVQKREQLENALFPK